MNMTQYHPALPIDDVLEVLVSKFKAHGQAVLEAPPGAGKTTRVPLALLPHVRGKILMLEPRRLAARASAERMAEALGEVVGQTVGYRVRGESKVSSLTRIEVVTEGILTRMIQSDAELSGVGLVIFDEFHERSLNADFGLALCLELRSVLRPDLGLLVMSATLETESVAHFMGDAPIIRSRGQGFEVKTHWLPRPVGPSLRYEAAVAGLVRQALEESAEMGMAGGILVFLPGEREIRQVQALLGGGAGAGMLGESGKTTRVYPLFGAMSAALQREVLKPAPEKEIYRRIILATSIAETSLTIPDIRVVVDGGWARRSRYDAASGMSSLVTERVTRAEARQRQGRAGRVAQGLCYRLWTKGEEGGLLAFPPAEIEYADLTGLALELALWGQGELTFLTPPHEGVLREAGKLLYALNAVDAQGRINEHGRKLARLPVHPRLGNMLLKAGPKALLPAALLNSKDPLRGAPPDILLRLDFLKPAKEGARQGGKLSAGMGDDDDLTQKVQIEHIKSEMRLLEKSLLSVIKKDALKNGPKNDYGLSVAQMVALAYPDRIGLRRQGRDARWVLSGGKGVMMAQGLPLSHSMMIVVTDLDGNLREARIRQAIEIEEADFRALFSDIIAWHNLCEWSRRDHKIIARRQERFGALVLKDTVWHDVPLERLAKAALEGLRQLGLPWLPKAQRLRARIRLAAGRQARWQAGHENSEQQGVVSDEQNHVSLQEWPNFTDDALMDLADEWLIPHLFALGKDVKAFPKTEESLRNLDLTAPLMTLLSWDQRRVLDVVSPEFFETPLGRRIAIDYEGETPSIEVRLQEMFGVLHHPLIGRDHIPLRIILLSPGHKPIQVTSDLPAFWHSSYKDVRKEMRGRYPKHPWPEDPTQADPTLKRKPRGG